MKLHQRNKLAALALIPTLGAAALIGTVSAATDTSSSTSSAHSTLHSFAHKGSRDTTQFATDLATILGLPFTDVKAKLDAGTKPSEIITSTGKTEAEVKTELTALHQADMKAKLTAQVASGKITQAQADQRMTAFTNHTSIHASHKLHPKDTTQFATDLASILELNAIDVKAKLDAGTRPEAIINASGKNVTDVMSALHTLHESEEKARIQVDLAAGKITQAQANALLTHTSHAGISHN